MQFENRMTWILSRKKRLLSDVANFASRCEDVILPARQQTFLGRISYGTLVRGRQLASAILRLEGKCSYDSRLQLRALLELYYNYEWIAIRPKSRASRFIQFGFIERLRIGDAMSATGQDAAFDASLRSLRRQRTGTRHLFRVTDKSGRKRWATGWSKLSFADRVREVHRRQLGSDDDFMYALYRWLSSTSHGSVTSMFHVLRRTKFGLRPKDQPEVAPSALIAGASILLLRILDRCATDLGFADTMHEQLGRLNSRAGLMLAAEGQNVTAQR
jgi:hypothetical protein